jgi:hypothetical protein
MNRILGIVSTLIIALGMAATSHAGFVLTITQVGSGVNFSYTGQFVGLVGTGSFAADPPELSVGTSYFKVTNLDLPWWFPAPSGGTRLFQGNFVGPSNQFFPGMNTILTGDTNSLGSGSTVGFYNLPGTDFFVTDGNGPDGSGQYSASGSFTYANVTLSDLGLTANTSRTWQWQQVDQIAIADNTFTINAVNAVPEPGSLALLSVAASGFCFFRRHRAA